MSQISHMRREIAEIPLAIERLLTGGAAEIETAASRLRDLDPPFLSTVARGSSDHVATYLKYVCEILCGLPVASIGPSVASVYGATLRLRGSAAISVSQSGKSPDIVELARSAGAGGALTIAVTNDAASPLAEVSGLVLDIHAGREQSVAATKTFVTSAVAGLMMIAHWRRDAELVAAIRALPPLMERAAGINWPELRAALEGRDQLFTLGRGPGFAISNETALKFKETCQIHAESYSSAEVLHGPVSIVGGGFPVLALASGDAAEPVLLDVANRISGKGARVFVTSDAGGPAQRLDHVRTGHPLTDPLALIVSAYAAVEAIAQSRGIDPDLPRHLSKVTETV